MIQTQFSSIKPEDFPGYSISGAESKILGQLYSHLEVSPLSSMHYYCKQEWQLKLRKLQNSYWTFLIKGSGKIVIDKIGYQVKAGDMIFFPEGTNHSFTHGESNGLEMINVHFHAKIYSLMDYLKLNNITGVFRDSYGLVNSISRELARLHALKPPYYKEQMTQMIRSLLLHVTYHSKGRQNTAVSEIKKMTKVFPALEMINEHLNEPKLKLSILASKLCISEVYLRKLFNDLFKESPVKFINHRRIEHACKLLRQTDSSVKSVAAQSGFNDLQFFYRVFTRITGTTPAKYRNLMDF